MTDTKTFEPHTPEMSKFFASPTTPPDQLLQPISVLYLLRREIQDCLIGKIIEEELVLQHPTRHRLFATAMLVFAGIDLVAKFAAGEAARGGVSKRFKDYLRRLATARVDFDSPRRSLTDEEVNALYRFRNSLIHSFGLYAEHQGAQIGQYIIQRGHTHAVVAKMNDAWHLCIDDLYEAFFFSIGRNQLSLVIDSDLRDNFALMFPKYGTMVIGELFVEHMIVAQQKPPQA